MPAVTLSAAPRPIPNHTFGNVCVCEQHGQMWPGVKPTTRRSHKIFYNFKEKVQSWNEPHTMW